MENIYQKVDYVVDNMSATELAQYLFANYPEYASRLEYVIGIEFQVQDIIKSGKEEE